jgi:hypothetical protein
MAGSVSMKRRYAKRTLLILSGFSLFLFFLCGKDTNPFMDPSLADVTLAGLPADTVSIFSTFEFHPDFELGFHFSRIEVHVDNNRLWQNNDTVCFNNTGQFGRTPLTFSASISDTGRKTISIKGFRSNGDSIQHVYPVYCKSPLHQNDIKASAGDRAALKTDPVKDEVMYVWKFTDDSVTTDRPISSVVIAKSFALSKGKLFVKYGSTVSPAVLFKITLVDSVAPVLWCVNESDSIVNNSIYTNSTNFSFKINAWDNSSIPSSITINNTKFDSIDTLSNDTVLCIKTFFLDSSSKDIPAIVTARDSSGNAATDTFHIHYAPAPKPAIRFTAPAIDSEIILDSSYTVKGVLENIRDYTSLSLFMWINGGDKGGPLTVTSPSWSWQWPVMLRSDTNRVRVVAVALPADTIARGRTVILYRPSTAPLDTAKVNFVGRDTNVYEGNFSIKVGVSCSKKASRQILVDIQTAGTAGTPRDFTISPQELVFNQGDSIKFTTIQFSDDLTCDTTKTLRLSLSSNPAANLGPDSTIIFTILDSDTLLCKKSIAFVSGLGSVLNSFENAVVDTFKARGYSVVRQIKWKDILSYQCVVIAPSVKKTDTAGVLLAGAAVPVLCASQACIIPLGMAKSADTGALSSTSWIQITNTTDNFLPSNYKGILCRITDANGRLPWARPGAGGHIVANGGSQVIAQPGTGIQPVVYPVFTTFNKGDLLASGALSPAKRLFFPTMEGGMRASPQYSQDWWNLLKLSVEWIMSSK